ncbi:mechanosensitive ion channel family protein [Egibacter rhizosphaerae]|uniref:Mechanosensitive ion channel family protein n=1 Tax=Egibacter rhizosphaerae TaxID=1670831 RepID=A0A411YAI5_9ACTN|nr:mechanosensitive ion channel family protein [Egibacter rhizosphaerae]QBI18230.1 mechanosensitive ion channel family protein [Egibacter rhizosphaerae]
MLSPVAGMAANALLATSPGEAAAEAGGAVYEFVLDLTDRSGIAQLAQTIVPPALRIVLILAIAYFAHRVVRRFIKRTTRRIAAGDGLGRLGTLRNRAPLADTTPMDLGRATLRAETIGGVLRSLAGAAIWAIAIFMILGEFDINLGPLIAGAGVVGVALGFGAQKLVQDFLAGTFMLIEDQYGLGDIVDAGEAIGVIEGITLRTTRVRDIHGTVWHIPNGTITRIGNMSQQWAQSLLDIGVAYNTDIPKAMHVIKGVADELWRDEEWRVLLVEEPEVWGVQDFGPSEILIRLVVKTQPGKQWGVEREIRKRLKATFDSEGIEIPFPQRTIWTRTDEEHVGPITRRAPSSAAAYRSSPTPQDEDAMLPDHDQSAHDQSESD